MASPDNTYSRFVALAKILLPLAALALLSTLFLLPGIGKDSGGLPYAQVEIEDLARRPRISDPSYAGVTTDGTEISLSAETARPRSGAAQSTAESLAVRLDLPDGSHVTVTAPSGVLDPAAGRAVLKGGVRVTTSTGYLLRTEMLENDLTRTALWADVRVSGEGPAGRLEAGAMELTRSEDAGYVLVFKRGVKLVYDPQD
ncbi:lipopolysaccharide export system protein LptC [Rhodovulum imhoffii]|uniref:Lipopolysaccharide export system protein LptC n=1 Tax=Rhodovulum imhoffii TaxID=365340 RepID=A0A2T5BPB4_9RHOB|nr:hypothetical protein [Rhodovulum imhoffii]MBK5932911.1 hypothetical protein [Rhodovulum imhoffii]PTN00847.1 lipopolysaccharide export system protein LptC [Rhodovulum imhoffii]